MGILDAPPLGLLGTPGQIAYAENISSVPVSGTSGGVGITGLTLYVAKADVGNLDLYIEWGGETYVTTGGQGNISMTMAESTGGILPSGAMETAVAYFTSGQAYTVGGPSVRGSQRIGKITTDKIYFCGVVCFQEGSSLAGGIKTGFDANGSPEPIGKCWMRAFVA